MKIIIYIHIISYLNNIIKNNNNTIYLSYIYSISFLFGQKFIDINLKKKLFFNIFIYMISILYNLHRSKNPSVSIMSKEQTQLRVTHSTRNRMESSRRIQSDRILSPRWHVRKCVTWSCSTTKRVEQSIGRNRHYCERSPLDRVHREKESPGFHARRDRSRFSGTNFLFRRPNHVLSRIRIVLNCIYIVFRPSR